MIYVIVGINPTPWKAGTAYTFRKSGRLSAGIAKNTIVDAYHQAIREEMALQNPNAEMFPTRVLLSVHFYYWRTTEFGKPADVSNINKATEDALQGVLYRNDRYNRRVCGEIVEEGPTVAPAIVIDIERYDLNPLLAKSLSQNIQQAGYPKWADPTWVAPEGTPF